MLILLLVVAIQCKAFDDGKYSPKKYRVNDDGKYYRPLDEGKYIPGDEGKYTYIYRNTLYPAFPYIHKEGPSGGFGGNGGNGGDGSYGGNGPNGPDGIDESQRIEYIGHKIYAERYPYIHKVIKALVDKYVSTENLFGETSEGSSNHYSQVHADKESAVKCHYLSPNQEDGEFVTQYPPRLELNKSEKVGTYYGYKGSKILNTVKNSLSTKIKLEYEVFVRVVEITE
ncbi:uncharacterized protein LOC135071504 isoform X2 [Ostrinia nubilalis]